MSMGLNVVRIRRRDGIVQRYKVKSYKRKSPKKKKLYKVVGYKRKKRPLGKKIHYTKIGVFEVAHDNLGNFRGSHVEPYKKK